MLRGTKILLIAEIQKIYVPSTQDYSQSSCFCIKHLLKFLALTKCERIPAQCVFLELFSIISFFISCTDDPVWWTVCEKLVLTVTDHFIIVPNYWWSVYKEAWIYISFWRKLFLNGSMLLCRPHSIIFLSNPSIFIPTTNLYILQQSLYPTILSTSCKVYQAPAKSPISYLSVLSAKPVFCQLLVLVCSLLLYTSSCNCLPKRLLKHISPLHFRTSEGHLANSSTRTSYFWVPHSISKRWL